MQYTELNRFDEHDRTILIGDNAYKQYFAYLRNVFEMVLRTYRLDVEGKQDEVALLQYFLVRLLNSINCLGTKYLFEEDFKLKVDQSASSYPNAYEFQLLKDEVRARNEKLSEMPKKSMLINELIQALYAKKDQEAINRIQRKLSLLTYFESIGNDTTLFLPFTPGQLTQLQGTGTRYRYMYTWGIFENTLSIPMLFQMMFEADREYEGVGDVSFQSLLRDLAYASSYSLRLKDIATYIDRTAAGMYPKTIKRLTIGPLYGKYTTADSQLAEFLNSLDSVENFALEVQSETIVSLGETLAPTPKEKVRQQFTIGKTRGAVLREVSECNESLFVPHELGQLLFSKENIKKELLKYKIVSLLKTNE